MEIERSRWKVSLFKKAIGDRLDLLPIAEAESLRMVKFNLSLPKIGECYTIGELCKWTGIPRNDIRWGISIGDSIDLEGFGRWKRLNNLRPLENREPLKVFELTQF